ncbi:MAG: methyltransferase domain-containing protein [Planctomycetota bacterium]|nr:MAG: methyltransferase domain-containing protein [Planctomycetota bacterium]
MNRSKMQSRQWFEKWYSGKEKVFAWNIGRPHKGLVEIFDNSPLKSGRVLVPGCGFGYDAIFLAERGFDVVAFDFSANVIKKAKLRTKAKRKLKASLKFEVEDIYNLPDSYHNAFDYVVEIGNFQAMSVKERREYVRIITAVLGRGGRSIVICKKYPPLTPGPKGIKKSSLKKYFSPAFKIEQIEPVLMYRKSYPADGLRLIAKKK